MAEREKAIREKKRQEEEEEKRIEQKRQEKIKHEISKETKQRQLEIEREKNWENQIKTERQNERSRLKEREERIRRIEEELEETRKQINRRSKSMYNYPIRVTDASQGGSSSYRSNENDTSIRDQLSFRPLSAVPQDYKYRQQIHSISSKQPLNKNTIIQQRYFPKQRQLGSSEVSGYARVHQRRKEKVAQGQITRFHLSKIDDRFDGYLTFIVGVDLEAEIRREKERQIEYKMKLQRDAEIEAIIRQNEKQEEDAVNQAMAAKDQKIRDGYNTNGQNANPYLKAKTQMHDLIKSQQQSTQQQQQPTKDPIQAQRDKFASTLINSYPLDPTPSDPPQSRWIGAGVNNTQVADRGFDLHFTIDIFSNEEIFVKSIPIIHPEQKQAVSQFGLKPAMKFGGGIDKRVKINVDQSVVIQRAEQLKLEKQAAVQRAWAELNVNPDELQAFSSKFKNKPANKNTANQTALQRRGIQNIPRPIPNEDSSSSSDNFNYDLTGHIAPKINMKLVKRNNNLNFNISRRDGSINRSYSPVEWADRSQGDENDSKSAAGQSMNNNNNNNNNNNQDYRSQLSQRSNQYQYQDQDDSEDSDDEEQEEQDKRVVVFRREKDDWLLRNIKDKKERQKQMKQTNKTLENTNNAQIAQQMGEPQVVKLLKAYVMGNISDGKTASTSKQLEKAMNLKEFNLFATLHIKNSTDLVKLRIEAAKSGQNQPIAPKLQSNSPNPNSSSSPSPNLNQPKIAPPSQAQTPLNYMNQSQFMNQSNAGTGIDNSQSIIAPQKLQEMQQKQQQMNDLDLNQVKIGQKIQTQADITKTWVDTTTQYSSATIGELLPYFNSSPALLGAFQHVTQRFFSQQILVVLKPKPITSPSLFYQKMQVNSYTYASQPYIQYDNTLPDQQQNALTKQEQKVEQQQLIHQQQQQQFDQQSEAGSRINDQSDQRDVSPAPSQSQSPMLNAGAQKMIAASEGRVIDDQPPTAPSTVEMYNQPPQSPKYQNQPKQQQLYHSGSMQAQNTNAKNENQLIEPGIIELNQDLEKNDKLIVYCEWNDGIPGEVDIENLGTEFPKVVGSSALFKSKMAIHNAILKQKMNESNNPNYGYGTKRSQNDDEDDDEEEEDDDMDEEALNRRKRRQQQEYQEQQFRQQQQQKNLQQSQNSLHQSQHLLNPQFIPPNSSRYPQNQGNQDDDDDDNNQQRPAPLPNDVDQLRTIEQNVWLRLLGKEVARRKGWKLRGPVTAA
ncbi:MAG: hypothetical protein EZS28_023880, partial [Streblomastix strix]